MKNINELREMIERVSSGELRAGGDTAAGVQALGTVLLAEAIMTVGGQIADSLDRIASNCGEDASVARAIDGLAAEVGSIAFSVAQR